MGTFRNRLVAIATILALFVTDPGSSRSVNISSSWLLPQNDFPVFYRHFRDRVTWFEADAVCQFHHAQLATVESSNQFEAVRNYLEELDVTENVWIGLKRNSEASEFTWTNYQPLARSGYFREEVPRSSDPVCVVTDPTSNFKWHSLHCGGPEVASFVCELPVPYWASKSNGCMTSMMEDMTVTFLPEHPAIQLTKECSPGISKNVTCRGNMKQSEIMEKLSCPNSKFTKTSFDEVQLKTTTSSSEADLEDYAIEMATIAQYNDETIQSISKVIRQTRGGGLVNLPQEMSIAQEPIKSVGRGGFDTNGIDLAFISNGLAESTAASTTTTTKTEPSTTTTTTVRPTTVTPKRTPPPTTTSKVDSTGGTSTTTVATTSESSTTTKRPMSTTMAGRPKATTKAPTTVSKTAAITTTIATASTTTTNTTTTTTTTTTPNDQHHHHHRRPALDAVPNSMITTSTTPKVVSATIRNSNTTATPQVVSAAAHSSSTTAPSAATTVVISKTTPPAASPAVDKPTTTTSRTPVTVAYTTAKIPRTTATVIRAPATAFILKPRVYKKIDLPQLPMMEDDDDDDNFLRRFTTVGASYAASVTAAKIPHTVATTRSPVVFTARTLDGPRVLHKKIDLPTFVDSWPHGVNGTTSTVSNHLTTGSSVTGNTATPRPSTTRPTTASPTQTRPMTMTTTTVKVTTKTAPADNHTSRVTVEDDNWKPTPSPLTPSSSASVTTSAITTTTPTGTTITATNTTPTVSTNIPHRKSNNYDVYMDHPNRNRHIVRPKQQHHHTYPFILYRLLG